MNDCVTLSCSAAPTLLNVHVDVVGANDSAAAKSSTGSEAPDAGLTPRRMMPRSTGNSSAAVTSALRTATTSSGPGGKFKRLNEPLPFAEPNHQPMPTCDVLNPVTFPKVPFAVRVVTFCTRLHCDAARAAISAAVYWDTVVRNPPESTVTVATEAVA